MAVSNSLFIMQAPPLPPDRFTRHYHSIDTIFRSPILFKNLLIDKPIFVSLEELSRAKMLWQGFSIINRIPQTEVGYE
jgi:hypothetical protein